MTEQELIEHLADKEHESWANWMLYLFSKCETCPGRDGLVIPLELVKRWEKQAHTPYERLSEREKQSDRDEVAHILPIIDEYTRVESVAAFIVVLTKAAKEFSESRNSSS